MLPPDTYGDNDRTMIGQRHTAVKCIWVHQACGMSSHSARIDKQPKHKHITIPPYQCILVLRQGLPSGPKKKLTESFVTNTSSAWAGGRVHFPTK